MCLYFSMFSNIIQSQLNNKHIFIKTKCKQFNVMSVTIKDNVVTECDYPRNSPMIHRYAAFHKMVEDLVDNHTIQDITFNINIADFPMRGMLNFCKHINHQDQFVCPNHRFSINDISIEKDETFTIHSDSNDLKDWDNCVDRMVSLYKKDDFDTKIPKVYASFKYESSRKHYVDFVLNNRDISSMYIYGGHPVHKWKALNNDKLVTYLMQEQLGGTKFKSFGEHSKYKYVMYLDGNALSDRMRLLLGMGSVIFRFPSKYEEFYTRELKPDINYVLVNDYNELRQKIEYYEQHPELCKQIVENNWNFLQNVLKRDNTLEYLAKLLNSITI